MKAERVADSFRALRDILLFIVGVIVLLHEVFAREAERFYILVIAFATMGLGSLLRVAEGLRQPVSRPERNGEKNGDDELARRRHRSEGGNVA